MSASKSSELLCRIAWADQERRLQIHRCWTGKIDAVEAMILVELKGRILMRRVVGESSAGLAAIRPCAMLHRVLLA